MLIRSIRPDKESRSMSDIRRRIKKAEKKLNLNQKHITINMIHWGRGELPPDRTSGNMTIHCVRYEDVREGNGGQETIETS